MSPEFISWAPDRSRLTHPLYLSLAQQLESDIVSGRLSAGTRLPPQHLTINLDYGNPSFLIL